jgi:hypothetical protein
MTKGVVAKVRRGKDGGRDESRPYTTEGEARRGVLAKPSAAMAVAVGDLATTRVVLRTYPRHWPVEDGGGGRGNLVVTWQTWHTRRANSRL